MGLNCFRPAGSKNSRSEDALEPAPRRTSTFHSRRVNTASSGRMMRRQGSAVSHSSTTSNDSISRLPPCDRSSYPKIESMMMPLPEEPNTSRCLRLSHPRIYSNIVQDMKTSKGCRDWRSFSVFDEDEVDITKSADEIARQRAADCERKLRQINSFSSNASSISVDMIG